MTEPVQPTVTPQTPDPTVTPPEPKGGSGKTFSQEDVDRIVSERLAREKAKSEEAEKHAREKAEADALAKNQEWQKLAEQRAKEVDELKAKTAQMEYESKQRSIAEEIGLPVTFADRIRGETPDAMLADAKSLLEAMPKQPAKPNVRPTNVGGNASVTSETDEQRRKRLLG
jgi:hypothetical protein